jgi:DNA-binding NtrC family response regulator/pSer/pThr/pTyr-binding forkhead associated (FHA) protein
MVTLAIEGAGGSQLTYQLDKPMISIGASSRNDVVLRAPGVAPKHLSIQRNNKVYTFLGQHRQVVVLNGERRSRGVLKVGDRIRIGTVTIVFQGGTEPEDEVEIVDRSEDQASPEPTPPKPAPKTKKRRSEIVLFRESHRLSEARQSLVEILRGKIRSDLVPALRTFLSSVFDGRQALVAVLNEEGRFQPVVSQWEGDLPRLPARTFDELASTGRYAVLRLGGLLLLVYPVDRGPLQPNGYVLAETTVEDQDEDRQLLGELACGLAVHWDRIEQSTALYGEWEVKALKTLNECLPGTSPAVKVLRDSVGIAARSSSPVMLCGRSGSGRMFLANVIASLRPAGEPPVRIYQARSGDNESLRLELFGPFRDDGEGQSLAQRERGAAVVVRDVHLLSPSLQRELTAAMTEDLDSGYGPAVRWIVTTDEDAMSMVNDGTIDMTFFRLFDRHMIQVPSLDERREDLPLLIVRLLERVGAEQDKQIRGIELETLNSLLEYTFEGQMAELIGELRRLVSATPDGEMVRGVVPRRVAPGSGASVDDGQATLMSVSNNDDLKTVIPAVERLIIDRVLHRVKGNQSQAARILNLSRGALIAKIKDYEIPDYRSLRRKS